MVSDTLQISAHLEKCADILGIFRIGFIDHYFGNIFGDFLIQIINVLFSLFHFWKKICVSGTDCTKAGIDIFFCHFHHTGKLAADSVGGNGGITNLMLPLRFYRTDVFQMHHVAQFLFLLRQDLGCQYCQVISKRQQDQGCHNVKQCMHICNLRSYSARCKAFDQRGQRRRHTYNRKDRGSDQVEHQVNDGGTFCIPVCSDGCQNRSDTGTDILSEQYIDSAWQPDQSTGSQRLKNTYRRRGRLDDRGKYRTGKNSQQRVGKIRHNGCERLRLTQRHHG